MSPLTQEGDVMRAFKPIQVWAAYVFCVRKSWMSLSDGQISYTHIWWSHFVSKSCYIGVSLPWFRRLFWVTHSFVLVLLLSLLSLLDSFRSNGSGLLHRSIYFKELHMVVLKKSWSQNDTEYRYVKHFHGVSACVPCFAALFLHLIFRPC